MARSKDILQAIDSAHAMGARSPISVWMRENYDEFAARLVGRRADWRVLARVFAEAGLTDNAGKPATPEAVRKTWQRVVSARARNCGAATAGTGPGVSRQPRRKDEAPVRSAMPGEPDDGDDLPARHTFTTARIRK